MDELSSRFLAAFNVVEDWMRHELDANEEQEFGMLLRRLEKNNSEVRLHSPELKRFAKLRNLIAHSHSQVRPLAVPTTSSVERLEAIGKLLLSPTLLLTLAAKPVEHCRPTDRLGNSVQKMHDGIFSQLPIHDGQKCLGLLTAETIARWLASDLAGGLGMVDEKMIADVMKHAEDPENHTFLPRTATVANGLAAFNGFLHRGKRLEAILITNAGKRTEALMGIVTIHDIPKLIQSIHV